jgi:hypothetical protein
VRRGAPIALLVACLAGCLGQTPQDVEADSLPDDGREGPTHRPGQPCLLCHGFAVAGTVYRYATDTRGLSGVEVELSDDAGHSATAITNSTGNFIFERDPWTPLYPLHVTLRLGGVEKQMRNVVHREGSCGECHKPDKGAASPGRIFLEDPP